MTKITAIETVLPSDIMPNLLLLRIHTDDGLVGHGDVLHAARDCVVDP